MHNKKLLILDFIEEKTTDENYHRIQNKIEYSPKYNLTVVKRTSKPAVFDRTRVGTMTVTKEGGEISDDDRDESMNHLLSTMTKTDASTEPSDDDRPLGNVLKTTTLTEKGEEPSDSDR